MDLEGTFTPIKDGELAPLTNAENGAANLEKEQPKKTEKNAITNEKEMNGFSNTDPDTISIDSKGHKNRNQHSSGYHDSTFCCFCYPIGGGHSGNGTSSGCCDCCEQDGCCDCDCNCCDGGGDCCGDCADCCAGCCESFDIFECICGLLC